MKKIVILSSITFVFAFATFVIAHPEGTQTGDSKDHIMLTPGDLKWGDAPPFLPAGAKIAALEGDPTKAGPFTIRLQVSAGYKIPPHTHPTAEKITVISGTFMLGSGGKLDESATHEMPAGSFAIMPAGMQHFAIAKDDVVLQVHGTGPFQIKYVNPADDPRTKK